MLVRNTKKLRTYIHTDSRWPWRFVQNKSILMPYSNIPPAQMWLRLHSHKISSLYITINEIMNRANSHQFKVAEMHKEVVTLNKIGLINLLNLYVVACLTPPVSLESKSDINFYLTPEGHNMTYWKIFNCEQPS